MPTFIYPSFYIHHSLNDVDFLCLTRIQWCCKLVMIKRPWRQSIYSRFFNISSPSIIIGFYVVLYDPSFSMHAFHVPCPITWLHELSSSFFRPGIYQSRFLSWSCSGAILQYYSGFCCFLLWMNPFWVFEGWYRYPVFVNLVLNFLSHMRDVIFFSKLLLAFL